MPTRGYVNKHISLRGHKITYLYCTGNIGGEYEFTVFLLLSGAIEYIPQKQQRKTSQALWNISLYSRIFITTKKVHFILASPRSN